MKWVTRKAISVLLCIVLLPILTFFLIRDFETKVDANNNGYIIRLLEITDSGTSDLSLTQNDGFLVDTMSMKRFVALRTDLDGLYDAVYIGKGTYSTDGVSGNDHKTATVMNDITNLKADKIIKEYLDKGLYVFIHKPSFNSLSHNSDSKLYKRFKTYQSSGTSHAVFFDDISTLKTTLKDPNSSYYRNLKQRPRLAVTSQPDSEKVYQAGDELTFGFNINRPAALKDMPLTVKLHMNVDISMPAAKKQDHEQSDTDPYLVAQITLDKASTGEIKYKLPKTYSGLLYWKLEVVEQLNANPLKDYVTGSIHYQHKKTVVRVLQVMPNNDHSSLKKTNNMNPRFLKNDDYELIIDTKKMDEFNTYVRDNWSTKNDYGLNGTYDMLIFGFADVYNQVAELNNDATAGVKDFIVKTKQSAMFTHDTIYRTKEASSWTRNFQEITGQVKPMTNMGLNAPNTSTSVVQMNEGLLTQYPFNLKDASGKKTINTVTRTHNQYFTLDLEDETVIPWYNILGSDRDVNDSWNHYYTYSKGNVTYSGTGHTQSFPEWEQRLFVNTMYRAFTGSNHAPEITVHTPSDNSTKPSYLQELVVSYTVDDWDWKDRNLKTSIKFKSGDKELSAIGVNNNAILSGETFTHTVPNPLPDGGTLTIEISAWDAQGAIKTETITVNIEKVSVNLETSRTFSENVVNNEVRRGEEVTISYTITPKNVPYVESELMDKKAEELFITDIQYEETFPPGLEILEMPDEAVRSGSLSSGYTLKKAFGDVKYKLVSRNGNQLYELQQPQQIDFTVKVKPNVKGVYLFNRSKIDYEDIHLPDGVGDDIPEDPTPKSALGIARDYTLFALSDINFSSSSFSNEGRVAAGGSITLSGFNIGGSLGPEAKDSYTIVAGKDLSLNNGTISTGKAAYNGTATLPKDHEFQVEKASPVDFPGTASRIYAISKSIGLLKPTSQSIVHPWNTIELTGENPELNVFKLNSSDLSKATKIIITAPKKSTVIVNVEGTNASVSGGYELINVQQNRVLFHFEQAVSLKVSGIHFQGAILAPKANIKLSNGTFNGTVIVDSMTEGGSYSITLNPFEGIISTEPNEPPIEEPVEPRPRVSTEFNELIFTAVIKVEAIQLEGTTMLVGTEHRLTPVILPEDADNKDLIWSIEPGGQSIISVTNGVVKAQKPGTAKVTTAAADGSGIRKTVEIIVIERGLTVKGPDSMKTRDSALMEAIYTTTGERVTGYRWEVENQGGLDMSDMVRLEPDPADSSKVTVAALRKGTVVIMVTVLTDLKPDGAITAKHTLNIQQRLENIFIEGPGSVPVNGSITLLLATEPAEADDEVDGFRWWIDPEDEKYVRLKPAQDGRSAVLTGKKDLDRVTIHVSTNWAADNLSDTHDIKITPVLEGLALADASLNMGDTLDLYSDNLDTLPVEFPKYLLDGYLTWSSDNSEVVSVDAEGRIQGLKKGIARVTVEYNNGTQSVTATATIKVSGFSSDDRY
ncbi:DUF5057 domain-containing protein [Paenibacillus lemnae]|uniref:DUF5057 domain-containing protein n=1 Tax=Paenibacillus lemnae TaxID=1330551 RepID=A0A848M8X6_PAELE|nr:DUF5057 domain-containing protein [Paenibacillus lemnae]NMO96661.1 DUF5057 domain-containing protein [Paenibacillus lemnae]